MNGNLIVTIWVTVKVGFGVEGQGQGYGLRLGLVFQVTLAFHFYSLGVDAILRHGVTRDSDVILFYIYASLYLPPSCR